jgi:hypothetical protein
VVKRLGAPWNYGAKRTHDWVKLKPDYLHAHVRERACARMSALLALISQYPVILKGVKSLELVRLHLSSLRGCYQGRCFGWVGEW